MRERRETLGTFAAVKGTKLEAHLGWARERLGDPDALSPLLAAKETALIGGPLLAVDWCPPTTAGSASLAIRIARRPSAAARADTARARSR
jgi:hypothetical protein